MKFTSYGVLVAIGAGSVAAKVFPARSGSRALESRDLSLKGRNILARQNFEYCDTANLYYCDTPGGCCGITVFSCLPSGAECCSSLSEYGFDLWCPSGSHCIIESGYVQCQDESGSFVSADSSAYAEPTSSSEEPTSTDPPENENGGSSSNNNKPSSKKTGGKKKISAAVIGGAVAGPLILAIIIGAVIFVLCLKKKKKAQVQANAAIIASHANGGQGGQPAMSSGPSPAPLGGGAGGYYQTVNQDSKTPAYTQQTEVPPTPIASPPPQWTPASNDQSNISPAPMSPPQQVVQPYNGGGTTPISPMSTGNATPYVQPMYQPQPVRGNAVELPLASQPNTQSFPKNGAHEMQ